MTVPTTGTVQVLVTVKASPQISRQYRDTVCVAGLYLPQDSGPPEHVRLYPVPFRYLDEKQRFQKYDIRTFTLRRSSNTDTRYESRAVTIDPRERLPLVARANHWKNRAPILERVERDHMCTLYADVRADPEAKSLGLVEPADVDDLVFEQQDPLSESEIRRREAIVSQEELNLFDEPPPPLRPALDQPPYRVKLPFRCRATHCTGHTMSIIDWELTAMQLRMVREGASREQIRRDVSHNFHTNPFGPTKRPALYVGNQFNPQRRHTFTILGLYYPNVTDLPPSPALF